MASTPNSEDWANERGKKWLEHLDATEKMLAPVDEPLLAALSLDGAARIAEVGCGGGQTTMAIADAMPDSAIVHGFDISPELVAHASSVQSDSRMSFYCEDAASFTPVGAQYDRLSSRFGIMFFPDPEAAFRNLANNLMTGGRFAFAVWGQPSANPWMMTLQAALREEVEVPSPEPDSPGPFRYAEVGPFMELLGRAGFSDVQASQWVDLLELGGGLDAKAATEFAMSALSISDLVKDDANAAARVRTKLLDRLGAHEQEGVVRLQGSVHIVSGVKL
ncbi:MAG: class I SAM-dependent methyltransferase [Pseudomonadota bacterium]